MSVRRFVAALSATAAVLVLASPSWGGVDAAELKREIARKERSHAKLKEVRDALAEYAFDPSLTFYEVPDEAARRYGIPEGTTWVLRKGEPTRYLRAHLFFQIYEPDGEIPDVEDFDLWFDAEMRAIARRSDEIRERQKNTVTVLDRALEGRAVEIEHLRARLKELESGGAAGGVDLLEAIAGTWSFGRMVDGKKVFLCRLNLTRERQPKGYVIRGCNVNESFWEIEGPTTIVFKHRDGEVTSRLSRTGEKRWEGPYLPPKDAPVRPGEPVRPHYIER